MAIAWSRRIAGRKFGAAMVIGGLLTAFAYAQAPQTSPAQPAAKVPTPRMPDGKPDLSGIWVAPPFGGLRTKIDEAGSGDIVFAAREGSFENFENDNALRRLGDRNKPLYKPEFWAKVRENDANGNELDPEFKCRLYGVPRLGAPAQIVQSKDQVVLLTPAGLLGRTHSAWSRPMVAHTTRSASSRRPGKAIPSLIGMATRWSSTRSDLRMKAGCTSPATSMASSFTSSNGWRAMATRCAGKRRLRTPRY